MKKLVKRPSDSIEREATVPTVVKRQFEIKEVILKIELLGRLGKPVSYKSSKQVSRETMPCYRRLRIAESVVKEFVSNTPPTQFKGNLHDWMHLSKKQRLDFNLSTLADGNAYHWEFV